MIANSPHNVFNHHQYGRNLLGSVVLLIILCAGCQVSHHGDRGTVELSQLDSSPNQFAIQNSETSETQEMVSLVQTESSQPQVSNQSDLSVQPNISDEIEQVDHQEPPVPMPDPLDVNETNQPEKPLESIPGLNDQEPDLDPNMGDVNQEELAEDIPVTPEALLNLDDVIGSIYTSFPLLRGVLQERRRALGENISAWGSYDTKVKGSSENQPVGFYKTYRQNLGLERQLVNGTTLFSGYKLGRGSYEPWYLERETNEGGEFKAGFRVPLLQDKFIDPQRAALWRAQLERHRAEPEIQAELIMFIRDGSVFYWDWVAAGEALLIAEELLELAVTRNQWIRDQVEAEELDPPVLQDNQRLILSREAKAIEADRKFQQAAIKLSMFYRNFQGEPILASRDQRPKFPPLEMINEEQLFSDIQLAVDANPVLQSLAIQRRQLNIDLKQAQNLLQPTLDAQFTGSQDTGFPTSPKGDKSEFEFEASLFLEVPIQRRKARGKITQIEAKMTQLEAKREMTENKIGADVQAVYAALIADAERVERAEESAKLARELARIEEIKFEVEESDLIAVNIRESQAAEAELTVIATKLDYYISQANYRAALSQDQVP